MGFKNRTRHHKYILNDYARHNDYGGVEIAETSTIVGSIYTADFLKRKEKLLANCVFNKFKEKGLESLKDLILELEVTKERKLLQFIESNFEPNIITVAKNFSNDPNTDLRVLTNFYVGNDTSVPV